MTILLIKSVQNVLFIVGIRNLYGKMQNGFKSSSFYEIMHENSSFKEICDLDLEWRSNNVSSVDDRTIDLLSQVGVSTMCGPDLLKFSFFCSMVYKLERTPIPNNGQLLQNTKF